jgi:hypothetical protein
VFSLGLVILDAATLRQHPYTHDWIKGKALIGSDVYFVN